MAVCNIFNKLSKDNGTFLTFSQYMEDLTKENVLDKSWKVTPSYFVAMDMTFGGLDNSTITKLLQDNFENGCAKLRSSSNGEWTPWHSANLFWKVMKNKFAMDGSSIKYFGNINIKSYEEVSGIGYSEIYCYIPSDAKCGKYIIAEAAIPTGEVLFGASGTVIEGYKEDELGGWEIITEPIEYSIDTNYSFIYRGDYDVQDVSSFDINTMVVLYDIYDDSGIKYKNIPMGIYFTGKIDDDGKMTNTITKYVTNNDIYGAGTSYGLRICSRYTASQVTNIVTTTESDTYSDLCRVLEQISITHNKLDDILSNTCKDSRSFKELYAIFKNTRTNVPYIKTIGNEDYWFVNGRMIHSVTYKYTDGNTGSSGDLGTRVDAIEDWIKNQHLNTNDIDKIIKIKQ